MGDYSFSFGTTQPSVFNPELSEATTLKIAALQAKLNQKLGPEYISQRPGPGGGPKLTYAEGWKIINLANEVFGFNGWSSNVISLTTDFNDFNEESRRYNVGVTAIVRVTLRDGVYHEDIGYGMLENSKSKGAALDKCKKEAVTDGLKRALRNFGNLLGNCLYDKNYTQEVVKIKVPQAKFDKSELHRRPEFEETKPNVTSTSRLANISMNLPTNNLEDVKPSIATASALGPSSRLAHIATKLPNDSGSAPTHPPSHQQGSGSNNAPTHPSHQQTKILSSIPSHVRSEINAVAGPSHIARNDSSTASNKSSAPGRPTTNNPRMPSEPAHHTITSNSAKDARPPITGHGAPNASRVHVPPQPQESWEAGTEDGDESYHFGSDDDAFLALVNLGEGDLGQPLLPEADLGRPLFDTDLDDSRLFDSEEFQALSSLPREQQQQQQSRTHVQQAAPPSVGILSGLLAQNQPQPQQQQRSSNLFSAGSKPPQQQQSRQTTNQHQRQTHPQQQQRSSGNQFNPTMKPAARGSNEPHRSHQNQNQNQPPVADTSTRPPTPSMGGFHFPAGVVCSCLF
ncbi:hypothetical protein C0991_005731 [Blastosporella zonata]|nr:hypothetical protein C0991_005731 [Blastosporella zonata]